MKISELKGRIVEDLYDWAKNALKDLVAKKMQDGQSQVGDDGEYIEEEKETSDDSGD